MALKKMTGLAIFKLAHESVYIGAGVAQLGQRRKTEALIPKGFVGSNPISRTISFQLYTHAAFSLTQ